jgi:NhaC family Na+:H+ antiporter
MGIDPGMTAGAVVSGAYFGDKLSPMSDTTNLAPAMAGTDLFTHIRHMLYTTGPSWVIAMIAYTTIGLVLSPGGTAESMGEIREIIETQFDPGIMQLLPPLVVIGLVLRRQPALPSLLLGAILGAIVAVATQGGSLAQVLDAAFSGYKSSTGNAAVDELLSRGGMMSMANTIFLVLCAMAFGGIMERAGMLRTLAAHMLRMAKTTASLITTTVLTCFGMNVVAADQYIAIVVPGRMYAGAYRERGLHAKNLSRALEDAGTITSPLIPWNSCGAFMSATLMVSTFAYLPYAFLNLMNPLISIFYGITGWTIEPLGDQDEDGDGPADTPGPS